MDPPRGLGCLQVPFLPVVWCRSGALHLGLEQRPFDEMLGLACVLDQVVGLGARGLGRKRTIQPIPGFQLHVDMQNVDALGPAQCPALKRCPALKQATRSSHGHVN